MRPRLVPACVLSLALSLLLLVPASRVAVAGEGDAAEAVRALLAESDGRRRFERLMGVVAATTDVEAVAAAVEAGRSWPADAPKGRVTWTRDVPGTGSHAIFAHVPAGYDASRAWPVLLWLHGGVGTPEDGGGEEGTALWAKTAETEGFLVLSPSARRGAEWWSPEGTALVRGALADLAARYRVDADRVAVLGFSDGASACFHLLAHDPEPYACFVAMMPQPMVTRLIGGPTFGANVSSRPVWAVSGGQDPLYPAADVEPLVAELRAAGCDLAWEALPEEGHTLSFLEERLAAVLAFVRAHPRVSAPPKVSWETALPAREGRRAWVEILTLSADAPSAEGLGTTAMPDAARPRPRLGIRLGGEVEGGIGIESVEEGTPAAAAGFRPGDVLVRAGDVPLAGPRDLVRLRRYLEGLGDREGTFVVIRDGKETVLRAAPRALAGEALPRPKERGYDLPTGRIEATATEGRIDVRTRGVRAFRLRLMPPVWRPGQRLVVAVNGTVRYEGVPEPDVLGLLATAIREGPGAPLPRATLVLEP